MSIKTSNTDFKTRIRQQIEDPIMRKAVANAQQRIGANRQKMVDNRNHIQFATSNQQRQQCANPCGG